MSIRSVQTKYRAAASFPVLMSIDTNSPAQRTQEFDRYFEKPSQPSFPTTTTNALAPSPVINTGSSNRRTSSTLSPYASPYKPRSPLRSSSQQAQNQYSSPMQRAGARAGRGAPAMPASTGQALDADFVVKYPQQASSPMTLGGISYSVSGGLMEPILSGPTYSHTSRFDPFGDFSAPENTAIISITSQPLTTFSPPTSSPASTTPFKQAFGARTGNETAYTHFYYYDKATNSPTLAYGSQQSNKRNNYNHNRNQWNHKAKPNNNNNQPQQYRRPNNKSFTPSRSPSRSPSPPSPSYIPVQSPPSRSPSPPSPKKASFSPSPVAFPVTSINSVAPSEDPFADPVPVPVRTRKRSNTISETPKAVQPTIPPPSISPPLPEPKPKVSEKKADSSMASRLVAAMLLNRVDATGRSRCGGSASKRFGGRYVKSGLSMVVTVEC
ncbi:hypothetical protein PM082_020296 [Marasmius tenuissimus]|nr:hypothetical protein PM082_020296 [Marasmius tenuissimus]